MNCPNCGYEMAETVRGLHRDRLPLRIVDLLEIDAPLTAEQIAAALNANVEAVRKALWRLGRRQVIEQLPVKNPPPPGTLGAYTHWRLS